MIKRIANLKYLIATFLFVTLFFIQSLTLTWTPGYVFQALILNIAIMLGVYAFRGFDNLTTYSLNSCIVSYISGTVLGVLFALIPIVFFTPRLPRLTFFVTAAVSGLIFPFLSCMLMRYTIKHLPPRRYLVIGREEDLGPILEEVKKASMGKIEIYSYMNPSAATLTEAISFEDVKPFDAILIGDPELARGVQRILNEAITKNTSIEYLPTLVESSLHRIPIEIIERFREYYEIVFSEARISRRIRVADIVFSSALLVLFSPFILFSVLYILIRDGRPIFFTQPRHGINARIFKVFKFRTMDDPKDGEGKPTTTKSGKLLRMTRLNEIPQLFCVLGGKMSLVGPRPDVQRVHALCVKEVPFYRFRTRVLPGITGHAQLTYGYAEGYDRGDLKPFTDRLSYDLYYVKNMDFRLYLSIMLRTVETMVFRRGAR